MIDAVLFDVGGPLDLEIRHEAAIEADIRAALEREVFPFSEKQFAAAVQHAVESFAPSLYKSVVWQLTRGNAVASARISQWIEEQAARRDFFDLRPGISEVLQSLQERGLKLGLVANQPHAVLGRLADAGLAGFFKAQAFSGRYRFRKPDVRLFLRVCEDLGVESRQCIMVGDRIDNDIVPAKALGMRTVLVRTGRHREQQPRSWEEVPDEEAEDAPGILAAIDAILSSDGRGPR